MAQSAGIKKMSNKHEEILLYMLANPTEPLGNVAGHFGVTFSWLSTIIHSHAFQDQLARRRDEMFDNAILQDIGDKLSAAAHVTLDAYLDKVPQMTADQLIASQDKLLGRLGYGTSGGKTVINGNVLQQNITAGHVSPDVIKEARDRIGATQVGKSNNPPALPNTKAKEGIEIEGVVIREGDTRETVR